MNRAACVGLIALSVSVACKSEVTQPGLRAGPPPIDSVVLGGSTFSGAPLTGKWVAAPGAGYTNLTIDVKEYALGRLEGTWTAEHGWCNCALSGRVSAEGATAVGTLGSFRVGSSVALFLVVGEGPFVLRNAWGTFDGKMVDATHMSGVLFYSDGSGYYGDNGIGGSVVISR